MADNLAVADSLDCLVSERDQRFTDSTTLNRNKRERVTRRVCQACWHVCLPKAFTPGLQSCPKCGGKLHEVTL
jgi:hypothetical protein